MEDDEKDKKDKKTLNEKIVIFSFDSINQIQVLLGTLWISTEEDLFVDIHDWNPVT